jgi:hypothetical protein
LRIGTALGLGLLLDLRRYQLISHALITLEHNAVAHAIVAITRRRRFLKNSHLPDVSGRVRVRDIVVDYLQSASIRA